MLVNFLRLILKIFWIFPIQKKKVILTAYNGRLFSCSPKYIAEGLTATKRYEVMYALKTDSNDTLPDGIKRIKYRSLSHYYHLMTAKFVVFNSSGFAGFLPYRRKQVIVQTWHGGYSFKVIGNDIFSDEKSKRLRKLSGDNLTYFLSGSEMATEQHSSAMSVSKEKFLNIGLPRNDILFSDHAEIKKKVYKKFSLGNEKKIVLYAPTYRDGPVKSMTDYGIEAIDDESIVNALNARFGGDFVFMYKAHHDMIPTNIGKNCINASDYSDIQELMCVAEIIITDYSSCMADFALQRKPGFLFTPDLKKYESVHPLSMFPELWPYSTAMNNDDLLNLISGYDENTGLTKIESFFSRIGNCEKGVALDSIVKIFDKHLAE